MSRRAARIRALENAEHVLAAKRHLAGGRLDQPQHAAAGRALAAARFADQREGLALVDGEADVVDRAHDDDFSRNSPPPRSKCLTRLRTSTSAIRRRLIGVRQHLTSDRRHLRRPGKRVAHRHAIAAARRERTAGGSEARFGTVPSIACSRDRLRRPESTPAAPACRDAADSGRCRAPAPASTMRPAIHHRDAIGRLGNHAEVVRDQQQRQVELALHLAQQLEDLRLHRHVQRGRRLVGDDERRPAGERDRHHHALPHAAGQLVRIVVDALVGIDDLHRAQQIDGARPRVARARPARGPISASAMCAPTRITGLSAAIGSWNTKPMPAPRTCAHLLFGKRQQVACPGTRPGRRRCGPGSCTSRMIENAVTDLPLPDSPTSPSVSPLRISNDTSLTATTGAEHRAQVLDLEQRFAT